MIINQGCGVFAQVILKQCKVGSVREGSSLKSLKWYSGDLLFHFH